MLLTVLISSLLPALSLPAPADSALLAALDSINIEREQLDFDRHWAVSVGLPDSTMLRGLNNIEELPVILSEFLDAYGTTPANTSPVEEPLEQLLDILAETSSAYSLAIDEAGQAASDSLLLVMSFLWADEDNPGACGEWGMLFQSRGLDAPQRFDVRADSLLPLLERWTSPEPVSVENLLGAAVSLGSMEWPEALDIELPGIQGSVISFDMSGPVSWVICGPEVNRYSSECVFDLIVDTGGDDIYRGGMAGAVGPLGRTVSLVIDLEGNDRYLSDSIPASLGCGVMGFGGVIDLSGNDVYRAGALSQGAGLMGQGVLLDLSGDDIMQADFFSQGAGCLGEGLLLDLSGDDMRRVSCFGQGFGGPGGRGILVDGAGHDCNLAGFRYPHEPLLPDDNRAMSQGFAMGLRPFIAGGIGLMADFGRGNDTYRAEVFGQGSAYFYGLGMLFDEDGQDSYQAAQYSQGSGIHLAAGCLWDGDGDDCYFSRQGPAQGSAHDLSTGFLLDGGGNDWYCSDGGQALSLNNSAAIFIDVSGADTYAVRGGGQAGVRWARGSSGAAVFLDLADRDFYLGDGGDSTCWFEDYATAIDLARVTEIPPVTQDEIGNPCELDIDSLFSVASEWGVSGNRERVLAHREELAARGEEAVIWLLDNHLDSWSGLANRAIKKALTENSEVASELLLELLCCDSLSSRELANTVYFLGEIESEDARIPLEEMVAAQDSTRSAGMTAGMIHALGKIGCSLSLDRISSFANHPQERIRRETAVALGMLEDTLAVPVLEELTLDGSIAVCSAAEASLRDIEAAAGEPEEDN